MNITGEMVVGFVLLFLGIDFLGRLVGLEISGAWRAVFAFCVVYLAYAT